MTKKSLPAVTLGLLMLVTLLHGLYPVPEQLYFNAESIMDGEYWRVLTGHLAHSDWQHLLWNGLGLLVLGTLIETRSPALFLAAIITGMAAVGLLLASPFSALTYYCGLSGMLNTLLVVALWLEWQARHSWLVVAVAIGSVAKVMVEISTGTALVTQINWPPYAWSHAAGMLGGIALVGVGLLKNGVGLRGAEGNDLPQVPQNVAVTISSGLGGRANSARQGS